MNERDAATSSPGALAWSGVVLVCLCAMLAGLLEALLVPYYVGSVIVPIAVVGSLASNVLLPRLARTLVPSTFAAALPFVSWLLVVVVFGVLSRPEGDVILPGGPGAVQYVVYGVLLGGALAGTITVVTSTPLPVRTRRPAESPPRKGSDVSR